ncbi:ankyrin repeat domain-containing protein [Candidatus Babela massiliensis]|uniref:Ankyrin repeats containing protein n=1 Tax=Candidatus Babela massiliensis TaxID=673862 RepID=V6DF55_9BACT|nr:ankyrin repeat domain-containing protein [Candidatus Babela massiliensis]CDK30184.1 Ankyrin repeats containing protein [Candidatus Babela massiliensis]
MRHIVLVSLSILIFFKSNISSNIDELPIELKNKILFITSNSADLKSALQNYFKVGLINKDFHGIVQDQTNIDILISTYFKDKKISSSSMLREWIKTAPSIKNQDVIKKIVIALRKINIDIDKKDVKGNTRLIKAVNHKTPVLVKELLVAGANPNVPDKDQWTPLIFAVHNKDLDSTKSLLSYNAKTDMQDNYGYTALMWASQQNQPLIVKEILKYKVDLNLKNKNGDTALIIASWLGHKSIVELLLNSNEVDINLQNGLGNTALMLAIENNHKDIVRLLLKNHANISIHNKKFETAFDIAQRKGYKDFQNLLLKIKKQ